MGYCYRQTHRKQSEDMYLYSGSAKLSPDGQTLANMRIGRTKPSTLWDTVTTGERQANPLSGQIRNIKNVTSQMQLCSVQMG